MMVGPRVGTGPMLGAMGPGVGGHAVHGVVQDGVWAGTPAVLGQAYLQQTGQVESRGLAGGWGQGGGMVYGGQAVDRGQLRSPVWRLTGYRTPWFTENFVRELDERNVDRMSCLPPWLQEVVAAVYRPGTDRDGEEEEARDVQKYFGGVIGGVRKMFHSGLTEQEAERIIAVTGRGVRMSYRPCRSFGTTGTCQWGDGCRYFHVAGVSED